MQPELYELLVEASCIQTRRRFNHRNGLPINTDLEAKHQAELAEVRKRLEAFSPTGQVAGAEETLNQPETNSNRGGIFGWLGNLFKTLKPARP